MQLYSDGGFNGVNGACGFVAVVNVWDSNVWEAKLAGCRGTYLQDARSAFEAEVIAADMAVAFADDVSKLLEKDRARAFNFPFHVTEHDQWPEKKLV